MIQLELPGYTVRESAKYLGISRYTMFDWIHSGKAEATIDVCGQYRIPYVELHRLIREREAK
jgi:excisionase family DNA binding protein